MITLDCPKCESPIDFTFDPGEQCATVDEVIRQCDCEFTDAEYQELVSSAERAVEDMDPPGDY